MFEQPQASLAQQWFEPWRQAGALALEGMAALALAWDMQRLRNQWLADLTRTMDVYLRSPAFLDLMRFNLGWMTRPGR